MCLSLQYFIDSFNEGIQMGVSFVSLNTGFSISVVNTIFSLLGKGLYLDGKLRQVFLHIITALLPLPIVNCLNLSKSADNSHGSLFLKPIPLFLHRATIKFIIIINNITFIYIDVSNI